MLQTAELYRSSGDCGASAAAAIPHLEEALTGLFGDCEADRRREVRIELSAAYLDATEGNRAAHLQRAIEHLAVVEKELLESHLVGLDEKATYQLFRTYLNLGTIYKACADLKGKIIRNYSEKRAYLARSIRAYRAARVPENCLAKWK